MFDVLTCRVNEEASAAAHIWPVIATNSRNAYYIHTCNSANITSWLLAVAYAI